MPNSLDTLSLLSVTHSLFPPSLPSPPPFSLLLLPLDLEYSTLQWEAHSLALLCPPNEEPYLAIPELIAKVHDPVASTFGVWFELRASPNTWHYSPNCHEEWGLAALIIGCMYSTSKSGHAWYLHVHCTCTCTLGSNEFVLVTCTTSSSSSSSSFSSSSSSSSSFSSSGVSVSGNAEHKAPAEPGYPHYFRHVVADSRAQGSRQRRRVHRSGQRRLAEIYCLHVYLQLYNIMYTCT